MTTDSPATPPNTKSMDDIMSLCKRRGFVYPASEIYGGINGFWDYGPMGAQLKKNLRDAWWTDVVMRGCNGKLGPDGKPVSIVPVDTCIIQNPKVWEASGHVAGFNDPMVTDMSTPDGKRFRADHLYGFSLMPKPVAENMQLLAEHLAGRMTIEAHPELTVIASTLGEALAQLQGDKRSTKKYTFDGFQEHETNGVKNLMSLATRSDGAEYVAMIHQVTMDEYAKDIEKIPSPFTGKAASLTPPRAFNLMFKTFIGATASEDDVAYLRPETAQGIFVNFKNVVDTTRVSVPFGIAQTGKSFRNEVTPRNFTFRSREFEQMEIEFFCHPDDAKDWYVFWRDWRMQWWQDLGLRGENLILREHDCDELAHYAKEGAGTSDIEYRFPFTAPGYGELEGIAHRTDFDLAQHEKHARAKLKYFDSTRGELAKNGQPKGEHYLPHVIEPSGGLDRGVLAILCEAYTVDESRPSPEFMKFHPRIAPIKAAVFPLVKKDGMPEKAAELHGELRQKFGHLGAIEYDEKQSIGKRYARMDEAGTPYCFTIDGDSLTDGTVTVRDRDTGQQERMKMEDVAAFLGEKLGV
ncbi:MAG: glycine--tRNA ligase [Phycisphaeraceae bacterium]|nr:MAG: glycine--tRNA ligase [Phycisphaeraceae bacterium]